jgi:hypothetical protein
LYFGGGIGLEDLRKEYRGMFCAGCWGVEIDGWIGGNSGSSGLESRCVLRHYIPYASVEQSIAKVSVGLEMSHRTMDLGVGDENESV